MMNVRHRRLLTLLLSRVAGVCRLLLLPGLVLLLGPAGCQQSRRPASISTAAELRQQLSQAEKKVLVAFLPDPQQTPPELQTLLAEIQQVYGEQLQLLLVDTTANSWAADAFRTGQTPLLVLFSHGKEIDRCSAGVRRDVAGNWLRDALRKADGDDESAATAAAAPPERTPVPELVLTTATFDKQLAEQSAPVLVDFWAPWCGPCLMLAPQLNQIAAELPGRLVLAKVNVDQERPLARRYVRGALPTMVLFHKGEIVDVLIGVPPPARLRAWITERLDRIRDSAHGATE